MKQPKTLRVSALTAASLLIGFSASQAQTLFSDSLDSSTGWQVNTAGANDRAIFGFDYSAVGIPASPNGGGSTIGLKLQANRSGGVQTGVSVSPLGQSFTGDYQLRFDLWQNFNGPAPAGGSGSTQVSGGGILTAGTSAQYPFGTFESLNVGQTGDGGTTADYRIYNKGNASAATSGYYAAGISTSPDSRNGSDAYYASFGGATIPAAQTSLFPQQTGAAGAGAPAFAWHDVQITKIGNTVTWDMDGKRIATIDTTGIVYGGNNILLNHYDINASSSADVNADSLLFGLFDNVRVNAVPEPSTMALLGVAGAALVARRRKK